MLIAKLMFYMELPINFMNKKSVILLSILIAAAFLFLNASDAFSQQKNDSLPEEISGGMVVENKSEDAPVLEIIEEELSENIGAEKQSDNLTQEQENKGVISQKSIESDKKYNDKIKRLELLNIAVIVLFFISLIFNVYIFIKIKNIVK